MGKVFKIPSVFMAIDKMTQPLNKMFGSIKNFFRRSEEEAARFERRWRSIGDTSKRIAQKSAIVGLALAAPLIMAARDAIAFEDRMAAVQKTTQATGAEMAALGQNILNMAPNTRTSIEELQKIAEIGGQMGIRGVDDLTNFTEAVNKFSTALGSDFQGGTEDATRQIASLQNLFKETRGLKPHESILKVGSAVNELTTIGARADEITEFTKRLGQLPDAIKPSVQASLALGAAFNKVGIPAEIAARGATDVLLTASSNMAGFAKQMGMTQKAASDLMNSNPDQFFVQFAKSLNGLSAEKLAKTLKGLKIGDVGAIKAIGALSSNYENFAKYLTMANEQFETGTSITKEYNTVNNTTAGKLQQAVNGFKALSISIGSQLLPIINDLLKDWAPVMKSMLQWVKENPGMVKAILLTAAALSAFSFIVSGVSSVIFLYSQAMLLLSNYTKIVTAAQWLWNAAMAANPIGLIIIAIAALIGLIAIMIAKWNEWGAALSVFMGPLGLIVSMFMSIRRNWEMIAKAFSEGGMLSGIKAIGKALLDAVLMPLQQIAEIIANATGADWAAKAAADIEAFRKEMGVNVDKPINNEANQAEVSRSIEEKKQTVGITINDKTGRAEVDNKNELNIPVKLSTTLLGAW